MTIATHASPAPVPASAARPVEVISWLREPKLPGWLGKHVHTEWILRSSPGNERTQPGLEVHRHRTLGPLREIDSDYRFTHMVPEKARPQALADAQRAAELIASSPSLKKMTEVPSDTFFFGTVTDDGSPFGNQKPDIAVGQGKLLVRENGVTRYLVGDLDDMRDIVDVTKQTVKSILDA